MSASVPIPPLLAVNWRGSHRLISSRYTDTSINGDDSVLSSIASDSADLEDLIALEAATNGRTQAEERGLAGISTYELLYGIPNAHVVNAAFTHPSETGSRFNDATRGAWYSARHLETSIAEVTYHKARRLAEIVVPDLPWQRPDSDVTSYDDWLADFRSTFHALQPAAEYASYLVPEPVPACYAASQLLAKALLHRGSNGLVYPSVRHPGECLVCFRPALVYNPRRAARFQITFTATASGYRHSLATHAS